MGLKINDYDELGNLLFTNDERDLEEERVIRLKEVLRRVAEKLTISDLLAQHRTENGLPIGLGLLQKRNAIRQKAFSAVDQLRAATTLEELDLVDWVAEVKDFENLPAE